MHEVRVPSSVEQGHAKDVPPERVKDAAFHDHAFGAFRLDTWV